MARGTARRAPRPAAPRPPDPPIAAPVPLGLLGVLGAGLVALVLLAFLPAFSAEFLDFDDDKLFTLNHRWRGLGPEQLGWMAATGHMGHYQPLTWLSFGVDYVLHGLTGPAYPEAGAYHATNVVLHALGALAFLWLAWRLFAVTLPALDPTRRALAAAAAAALWAVHPLRVESVVWLTERRDVLSTLFFLLALDAWLAWAPPATVFTPSRRTGLALGACTLAALAGVLGGLDLSAPAALRVASLPLLGLGVAAWAASVVLAGRGSGRGGWLVLAAGCLVLSLLAKAWGMVLPALLVVLDAWPLRRFGTARVPALVLEKLPLVVPALVFARLAHWAQASTVGVMPAWDTHPLGARVAQAFYGLAYYPARTLAPLDLLPIYELPASMSLAEPRWLLPALAVLVLAGAAVALRRRAPALLAAGCAYAVLVAPVLGFVQSGPQLVADRYAHLATMPLVLLAAGGAAALARTQGAAVALLGAGLVAGSAALTWHQATFWTSSTALWERAYAVAPESPLVLNSLGAQRTRAAEAAGDPARALALLREADALYRRAFARKEDPLVLRNQAQVRTAMSVHDRANARLHQRAALELSQRALELARARNELTPDYLLAWGTDLVNDGQLDAGIAQLRAYVDAEPDRLRGLVNLGGALTLAGRAAEALPHLERACALEPGDARGFVGLARAYEALGQRADALAAWERARVLGDALAAQRVQALRAGD
ncbi:MAG: hypothetical protein KIT14_10825 [bacterium]|nr:hypothetical protein [bacterium]